MGLFNRKKRTEAQVSVKVEVRDDDSTFDKEAYLASRRLWDECQADAEYQSDLNTFYALLTHIREMYSVIGSVGSFSDEAGGRLIDSCAEAIEIEEKIREKREYYENTHFEMSEPRKTLAMIYEKRGDYEHAANVCAFAIRSGYPKDGTDGGMRGRMARMIKKGNLPLTDAYKEVLGL